MKYNPKSIERKWQKKWEKLTFNRAKDFSKKPKKYILVEFPYTSGGGLHVGHIRSYSALDALARKKRMEGFNVLYPMGWDAFGLPTENHAIKTGIHPSTITAARIKMFKKQMKSLGLSFDWSREINTTDPKYYKWTQWIFLQLFKKGLAYQAEMPINWCPSCKIGLANEEVVSGKCERCGAAAIRKTMKQWVLKITDYADRLAKDLDKVNYLEKIKTQQVNWIGRSEGVEVDFPIVIASTFASLSINSAKQSLFELNKIASSPAAPRNDKKEIVSCNDKIITIFTTRLDTIFGVTAVVIAPEHPLAEQLTTPENKQKVSAYVKQSQKKSEFERTQLGKEKTGVFTGSYCLNPANGEKIPIWLSDYVVATYGGGAVMIVPAHDKRDYQFAKKYGVEIREVVVPCHSERNKTLTKIDEIAEPVPSEARDLGECPPRNDNNDTAFRNDKGEAFVDYGVLVNSSKFNDLSSREAIKKIGDWLIEKKAGRRTVHYKLRDWIFSRQHYWGEPIPIIHCQKCGAVAVPEKDLPVKLPFVKKYQPTNTGESPLAKINKWINVKCPKCKGPAKRETDTMPNWAGSSWYFLRYLDSKNGKKFADSKKLKYWLPVDLYNGGMEHTTLHLLYSRFWHKFLYDLGLVPTAEPYQIRYSHGVVLAPDNRKMSKSFGNAINPNDVIAKQGADTLRLYEMFMGPFDQMINWNNKGVQGCYRFLNRVWQTFSDDRKTDGSDKETVVKLRKLIKKISGDLETMKFNTAVAGFMEFINFWNKDSRSLSKKDAGIFLKLLAPFAPHIAEELWEKLGNKKSIFLQKWPECDEKLIQEKTFQLIIQINGRVRDKMEINKAVGEEGVKELVLKQEKIKKWLDGKTAKKVIYVKERLVNLVM